MKTQLAFIIPLVVLLGSIPAAFAQSTIATHCNTVNVPEDGCWSQCSVIQVQNDMNTTFGSGDCHHRL